MSNKATITLASSTVCVGEQNTRHEYANFRARDISRDGFQPPLLSTQEHETKFMNCLAP